MAASKIKSIAVIGAGQMGGGIAQVAASAGLEVVLIDKYKNQLDRALGSINKSLEKLASKNLITEDPSEVIKRISSATDMQAVSTADYIIEAVPEIESIKSTILRQVDHHAAAHAAVASNTSSISITRLAASTNRPDKVIGMHFMNPVPIMALVEVIRGLATSTETFQMTLELSHRLGKQTCISADRPGFIVNRVLMPMINESFYALMEGVAGAEDIDLGMKLGTNQPMGPLTLADFIGLDTCLSIMKVLHLNLGDDKYRACPLLSQYVDAGWLGRKTGRGVYMYDAQGHKVPSSSL